MLFQYSEIDLWYKVDRIRGHWAQEIQWQGQKIQGSPIFGIQTVLGPLFISATIKVCDFKFGIHNLGSTSIMPKTTKLS